MDTGAWTYPPDAVIGVLGSVPLEEYAFFSLETLLCGFVWATVFPAPPEDVLYRASPHRRLDHSPPPTTGLRN